jgi:hypothetical protein
MSKLTASNEHFKTMTKTKLYSIIILLYLLTPVCTFGQTETPTDTIIPDRTMNVNRLEQPLCEPQTVVLRTKSLAAYNIRLKEILKRRALFGNQTVVLLTSSGALTNGGASNPFFLKLR